MLPEHKHRNSCTWTQSDETHCTGQETTAQLPTHPPPEPVHLSLYVIDPAALLYAVAMRRGDFFQVVVRPRFRGKARSQSRSNPPGRDFSTLYFVVAPLLLCP